MTVEERGAQADAGGRPENGSLRWGIFSVE